MESAHRHVDGHVSGHRDVEADGSSSHEHHDKPLSETGNSIKEHVSDLAEDTAIRDSFLDRAHVTTIVESELFQSLVLLVR